MDNDRKSPKITEISWGHIEVAGMTFKDAKIYPGGARSWNWGETSTKHHPGIQPADITELVDNGVEVVVLSTGVFHRLKVQPDTLNELAQSGIDVYVLPTKKAVEKYNNLRKTKKVGGLFHTTC